MHELMNNFIDTALIDADIILLLVEPGQRFDNTEIIEKINSSGIPVLILINKIDLAGQEKTVEEMEYWKQFMPKAEVIPISALNNFNVEKVFDRIMNLLPENEAYFDKEDLTDRSERFFVSEIIREKILLNYQKEIPYSVEVTVESFKESEKLVKIAANIIVSRESQKAIILGHQGKSIKKTGTLARIGIEEFLDKKVFLELSVKVDKEWRDSETSLRRFGYNQ
jgi:GTP-binding protein Era